jgi:hypothetical protein
MRLEAIRPATVDKHIPRQKPVGRIRRPEFAPQASSLSRL